MSKPVSQQSLGVTFNIAGAPASAEEFDQMAGETGACVAAAVDDYVKHTWLGKFRTKFAEALEKHTGVARKVVSEKPKKSGGVTVIYERETSYIETVEAETGKPIAEFSDIAQTVADSIPFDLTGVSTGGRIGKEFLSSAEELIDAINAKGGDFSKFIDHITTNNPAFSFAFDESDSPTLESVALAIKVDTERVKTAARRGLAALA